jgi:hypothetical protein
LLGDGVFLTAVEEVQADIQREWAGEDSSHKRDALWHEQHALARVVQRLIQKRTDMEIAEKQLNPETRDPRLGDPIGAEHTEG